MSKLQEDEKQRPRDLFTIKEATCGGYHVKRNGQIERQEGRKPRLFTTEAQALLYIQEQKIERN